MELVVQRGHTFWLYSQLFQIPLQLIVDSNKEADPMNLKIGETIKIPGFISSAYTIQPGDTFWSISSKRNIPLQQLLFINSGIEPTHLRAGTTIKLPIRITWRLIDGKKNYDYETLVRDIRMLLTVYPFIQQGSIGNSVMQKQIPEMIVGTGPKKVHVNGSFHANEWITTSILMTFLNDYLLALTNQTCIRNVPSLSLYEKTFLSIVPMVNPDGVNLVLYGPPDEEPYKSNVLKLNNGSKEFSGWKANIRGIDLNNQFPARWSIEKERKPKEPGPRDYPGQKPLSEPESIAIANLTKRRNFDRVLAFHSQGKEIYWGFEGFEPPIAETIVSEFARASGYKPVRYLDSYAGYKDWFIQEWKRSGFTIEVGMGVNPLPLLQFDEIYYDNLGILLASLYM
ncbi:peptidase M14 [Pueribacillus theae]|uniref:Peptidase M14 n=1 Tax=Pueribacillus theae TaxID=2171751 RepID=A0A2U1K8C7_9BACI|nr:M14 family metallopeptidase [Pueribacillus theae]PWA13328.1 peptidase M14 [Pueribacillus theae]